MRWCRLEGDRRQETGDRNSMGSRQAGDCRLEPALRGCGKLNRTVRPVGTALGLWIESIRGEEG